MGGSSAKEKPAKLVVPREAAGESRLAHRDDWNFEELDIVRIFKQYDVDKSGYLEDKEFITLLAAYNKGTQPKPDEVAWMMKVADKDNDNKISKRELLYAMQAWYGYSHLSQEYGALFDEYDADHNGYLDISEFQKLLQHLNDNKPVRPEEAQMVLATADLLGDGRIGRFELLGAVGIWFMSVGRQPTPEMQLTLKAMQSEPRMNIGMMCVSLIFGGLALGQALKYGDNQCKEDLDGYLLMYGVSGIATVPLGGLVVCLQRNGTHKYVLGLVCLAAVANNIAGFVVSMMGLHGVSETWSEADRELCGTDLWNTSCALFLAVPVCNIALLFCCCCCLCCFLGLAANRESESELHQEHQEMSAVAAKTLATNSPDTNSFYSNSAETKPLMEP